MIQQSILRLVAELADRPRREETARALAGELGAAALLILVEDLAIQTFVPAPGFEPTLPGGREWRDFLANASESGTFSGHVPYPDRQRLSAATAFTDHGIMLIVVGEEWNQAEFKTLRETTPLLSAILRTEHELVAARGELKAAHDHARQTEALTLALDSARADVERALVELERNARELQAARTRAEDATQAKDAFLAMVGHELRTPLSPILTALQLMRLKNQTSREQDIIERQVASLIRLVDDLLDVSRITQGKIELQKERVEVSAIAARAIEMASPVLERKQQRLVVRIPARGLVIEADPFRLSQVFANLLTNAAKYSDSDTQIDFSAEHDEQNLTIRVKDRGIGLGAEMVDRVFEIFVQDRPSSARSEGGLGLGLAIVRSLVTLHGGSVRAYSDGEGRGSEFVVQLPLVP